MTGQLALFFSLGITVYSLSRTRAICGDGTSWVSWVVTLWMARVASRSITSWLSGDKGDGNPVYGSGWDPDQMFWMGLLVLSLGILVFRGFSKREIHCIPWLSLTLFLLTATASLFWSIDQNATIHRLFRAITDISVALLCLTERDVYAAIRVSLYRVVSLLIPLSFVLAKFFPQFGRGQAKHWEPDPWIGVATHKNTLGQFVAISVLFLFTLLLERRQKTNKIDVGLLFLFCLSLRVLMADFGPSISMSSVVIYVVGTTLFLVSSRYNQQISLLVKSSLVFIIGFSICLILNGASMTESLLGLLAPLLGKDPTLADRTALWDAVIDGVGRWSLGGLGFGAFWRSPQAWIITSNPRFSWGPGQAHNGWIELYANLGWIGILVFLFFLGSMLRNAVECLSSEEPLRRFGGTVVVMISIHNTVEASFARPGTFYWSLLLLIGLFLVKKRTPKKSGVLNTYTPKPASLG